MISLSWLCWPSDDNTGPASSNVTRIGLKLSRDDYLLRLCQQGGVGELHHLVHSLEIIASLLVHANLKKNKMLLSM